MEVYGERPKKFTKEWWGWVWLYYKWHIVAAIGAVVIIVTTLHDCANRTVYDLQITTVTDQAILESQKDGIRALAEDVIDDATGNGEKEVYVMPIMLSDKNGPQGIEAEYTRFAIERMAPEGYVFIMSQKYAEMVNEDGILEPTDVWAPGVESNGYAISLKDNEKLKELGIDMSYEELYVGVVQLFEENREDELEVARHENGVKFARTLLGLE